MLAFSLARLGFREMVRIPKNLIPLLVSRARTARAPAGRFVTAGSCTGTCTDVGPVRSLRGLSGLPSLALAGRPTFSKENPRPAREAQFGATQGPLKLLNTG